MLKKFVIFVFCAAFVVGLNCADEINVINEDNIEVVAPVEEVEEIQEVVVQSLDELNPEILEAYEKEEESFEQELFDDISDDDLNILTDNNTSWEQKLNIASKVAKVRVGGHLTKHQERYITVGVTAGAVLFLVYLWNKRAKS